MTSARFTAAPVPRWVLRVATALAMLGAMAYFTIGLGLVPESFKSPPAPVMVVAGLAYLIGGGLILVAHRRLMLAGAVANALVLLLFVVSAFMGNATIDALSLSRPCHAPGAFPAAVGIPGAQLGPTPTHSDRSLHPRRPG